MEGLIIGKRPRWRRGTFGRMYATGAVHVFECEHDAYKWAAWMDWALNKQTGSGKISIVRLRSPEGEVWQIDENDPLSHVGARGKWLCKKTLVPAERIESHEPFTEPIGSV